MAKGSTMLSGLTNKSASASDSSTKPPSGSVSSDATRKEIAPNQPTIGPRCA